MKSSTTPQARFDEAVDYLRQRFPELQIHSETTHPELDAVATLPAQGGLDFPVSFNLQNVDELHLCASSFWVAWFPCTEPEVFAGFLEAVEGLLSGRFRILETLVGGKVASSALQKPTAEGWTNITGSSNLWLLLPLRRKHRVVQNRHDHSPGTSTGVPPDGRG